MVVSECPKNSKFTNQAHIYKTNRLLMFKYTTTAKLFKIYHCSDATKYKHVNKISCSASKRALLQHSTITIGKYHIEQKIEAECSEKEEWSQQSPYL